MKRLLFMFFLANLYTSSISFSQETPDPNRLFIDIASSLECPTCQGSTVLDSSSPIAENFKHVIKKKIEEGSSKRDIIMFFVERYGPSILRGPHPDLKNLIVVGTLIFSLALWSLFLFLFFYFKRSRH